MSVNELLTSWETINTALGLSGPVRDDAHYAELLAFVDEVFEKFGHDDRHPIFTLVSLVAERIREYEDRQHPWPDGATPASAVDAPKPRFERSDEPAVEETINTYGG